MVTREREYAVVSALNSVRFTWASEQLICDGIAATLDDHDIAYGREVQLEHGRIDFLAGDVGIEVKVAGSLPTVLRQCQRYAHDPRVQALILATTRATHLHAPATVAGVPLTVLRLKGAL